MPISNVNSVLNYTIDYSQPRSYPGHPCGSHPPFWLSEISVPFGSNLFNIDDNTAILSHTNRAIALKWTRCAVSIISATASAHASYGATWRSALTGDPTAGAVKLRYLWSRATEITATGTNGGRRRGNEHMGTRDGKRKAIPNHAARTSSSHACDTSPRTMIVPLTSTSTTRRRARLASPTPPRAALNAGLASMISATELAQRSAARLRDLPPNAFLQGVRLISRSSATITPELRRLRTRVAEAVNPVPTS